MNARRILVLILLALVTSCRGEPREPAPPPPEAPVAAPTASPTVSPDAIPDAIPDDGSSLIEGVPHVRQKPDFCGEACAEMFLTKLGKAWDQDAVFDVSGLDPLEGRGCYTKELWVALKKVGFEVGDVGDVWHEIEPEPAPLERLFEDLVSDLSAGVPSIVCQRYDESPRASEHFRLILGYDAKTEEVIYHEPAEDDGAYRRMSKERFLLLWPLRFPHPRWTAIRFRLAPGEIAASAKPAPGAVHTAADHAQRTMEVRKRLPSGEFTLVLEEPFIVIGDDAPEAVRRWASGTVRWAAEHLRKSFFDKDPPEVIAVWLFKDKRSYEVNTRSIFGSTPSTPYGYYSPTERALIMNIATGGGTLVHEMVHAYVEGNVPNCPTWFNEALGSLFEQCGQRDGRIIGRTNWRLAGLKTAIRKKSLPTFEVLCGMSASQFYGGSRGDNYAQARYLFHDLQEQGKLRAYYRAYLAAQKEDPTGYATLKTILGAEDMVAWQKDWEARVMKLRFP